MRSNSGTAKIRNNYLRCNGCVVNSRNPEQQRVLEISDGETQAGRTNPNDYMERRMVEEDGPVNVLVSSS